MQDRDEVGVLVVGGALSGLSTAVFLGWHGVKALVVERHPDTLSHPRARGINPRTTEVYRQVGLESALWAETNIADFSKLLMLRAETLAGPEIFSGPTDQPDPTGEVSPCEWVPIDQHRLESVLRAKAVELGAELRFDTELVSFTQDADGVDVVLRDRQGGNEYTVRASYVVGADGHRSPVRAQLGVQPQGPGEFATALSLLFDADLTEALRGRPIGMAYLDKPAPQTILYAADGRKRWVFAAAQPPGTTLDDLTDADFIEMVRAGVGQPDLDVEIIPQLPAGGVKALNFYVGGQVVERYQVDRVFLVGDAAHLVPPTGGFGASLGIQDAHNLAWKLAAVLNGTAGAELLYTYQAERAPVAWMTLQQTLSMMQERTGDAAEQDESAAYATAVFGYRYGQGAPVPPTELNAEPGTRAPHHPVSRAGTEISTLDLYGKAPVLLAGSAGQDWVEVAAKLADRTGVPLDAYRVGGELADPTGRFEAAHGITANGAVLVRPDGFVAWRCADAVEAADVELATALGALFARTDIS
ncbi:FAD-dependent monooxygenase [Actinophytocola sp.]|uniref:FAD-dependent monooxygenase n=1 Tax=Actinophytocola sp. TaxID=1872138 RepID=UPI002D7E4DC9|nr:FAD-dependent monooxygenase [Actinophytocola sp.]HET9141750.1 FAD-dependent monooxygenase [Actinophytocola sp.]